MAQDKFDQTLKSHLKLLQDEVIKILKKIKKPGLDYNIQFSLDCMHPNLVYYSVWIQPPEQRLNRLSWVGKDFEDLIAQLRAFDEKTSEYTVEIAYHNAQIESCRETIKHHEEEIVKLVELEKEEGEEE